MIFIVLAAVLIIGSSDSYEIVPRASGLKKLQASTDVRRAPAAIASFAPLAKSLKPASTGVRRAPELPSSSSGATAQRRRLPAYRPRVMSPRRELTPAPLLLPQVQFVPVPVPVLTPQAMLSAGGEQMTLPTLAPHTFPTFTPIPGLPTMPSFTMPPSFQRLLGITTTTTEMPPRSRVEHRRHPVEEDEEEVEKNDRYSSRDLNTVRSRIPKFVRGSDDQSVQIEKDADWMVPFE